MTLSNMQLDAYPAIRTKIASELREQIDRVFGGGRLLDLPDGEEGLDAKGNLCKLSRTEIWCGAYGVPIKIKLANTGYFRLQYCSSGSAAILINKERITVDKNRSCILPSGGASVVGEYGPGYRQTALRIEAKNLTEKLIALTGLPINRALEFEWMVNLETSSSQHLRRMMELLMQILDSAVTETPSLAIAEFEQALMVAFLCANRHNYSHLLERRPSNSAPWQVRRAEEYIEANWDRPISVEDVAAVAGVSARSIFRTFQQSRGYSPLAFAKQVRLRHARCILNLADATTTVTDVAFACGFGDLGHFSKDYRRMFGELPSQALGRAKGTSSANH